VLANRGSGSHDAERVRDDFIAALDAQRIAWSWHTPADRGAAGLDAALREALQCAPDVLIAAGGDGTVNRAANALMRLPRAQRPALGVLPLGTFNYVARRYCVPIDNVAGAAALVVDGGSRRHVGAGEVNGHLFLNNCCFGLYTSLIEARERHKARFGRHRVVAVLSALATLLRPHGRLGLLLQLPERTLKLRASLVFVGANPLQLDDFGPDFAAAVTQGALGFVVLKSFSPWRLLQYLRGVLLDTAAQLEEVDTALLRDAEIVLRRRRLRCVVDGELTQLATPLRLRWRDDVLTLCAPPQETP
jgi:diacylglycerol kinase family enzyme